MTPLRVSIVGGSGYAGGELVRLLSFHPHVVLGQITSKRQAGRPVSLAHPNLRNVCRLDFCPEEDLRPCDLLFLCLPHGRAMETIDRYVALAPRLIDLSADFRLRAAGDYDTWYGAPHACPDRLGEFVYGLPELHREELREARRAAIPGCNATAAILALHPLFRRDLADPSFTVIETKAGSSEGGAASSEASHHPERSGCVRSYKPTGHRHTAEIAQELGRGRPVTIHFSATAVEMVRGILATCHVRLNSPMEERDIWRIYREEYGQEPFIRIVKDRHGIHRHPEPKILAGSNHCDIGFEKDPHGDRLVVMSAIDNLMKGAAGQAVQVLNLMNGWPETTALEFPGLHPI
ncbi:MAG: N-acetyl-gamma-glutamyl-phosphate reductase [Candidatus Polarisedimenticolia bacterium]